MSNKTLSTNKNFLIGSILTGLVISVFALFPQIDLWMNCENNCNGIYAITDIDEPFYAAYLQSLMDGKPRRNSPYSGAVDSPETPQKESGLYIQFLASYPLALIGKVLGLSISQLMIFTSWLAGFLAAFAIYWLIYQFTEDNICAFVGTMVVLFLGATIGGQGTTFSLISSKPPHLEHNLIFLRRIVPAIGFPSLFLFILFVWNFFKTETHSDKLKSLFFALASFTFAVYTYFYFWTTLFAWFLGLIGLFAIFNFAKFKENFSYLLGFGVSLILALIPYGLMVSNREVSTDAVLVLTLTRELDLWRLPEVASYVVTGLVLIFAIFRLIDLKDNLTIFLLSLNLVTVVVFNQQVITGRSIQPFHYQFYCVNYLVTVSAFLLLYILLRKVLAYEKLKLVILVLVAFPFCVGIFDTLYSNSLNRAQNLFRDQLVPVSERIKEISQTSEVKPSSILVFDFVDSGFFSGIDLPALTSQPILWGPHLFYLPDTGQKENIARLNTFLYYQNVSPEDLRSNLARGVSWEAYGFFGAEKTSSIQSGKPVSVTKEDKNEVFVQYERFVKEFSYQNAQSLPISFVLVNKNAPNNFNNLDLWYERHEGEEHGDFILYRVKLRQQ